MAINWRRHWRAAIVAGVAIVVGVALLRPSLQCVERDKACAAKTLASHPVRRMAFWQHDSDRALEQRVGPAPQALLEYLNLDNIRGGFPERPRGVQLDAAFLDDVHAAFSELPQSIQTLFRQRLVGIYFVDDLGSTGYTDVVFDQNDKPVAGFIVLDRKLLQMSTANAWATRKENTPFKWHSAYQLQAQLEQPANDNRKNAIQYILLHELGHVLSIGRVVHPPWTTMGTSAGEPKDYPFFNLSWLNPSKPGVYVSLFDGYFPLRKHVAYYFGARFNADQMQDTYTQLETTNFPSLYAATGPADDFAEAFVSYVHVVVLKRPWHITISRHGSVLKVFNACWGEARCADKQALLEAMLTPHPS